MIVLVDDRSTGDLVYLINDTPTDSVIGVLSGHSIETRPSRLVQMIGHQSGRDVASRPLSRRGPVIAP